MFRFSSIGRRSLKHILTSTNLCRTTTNAFGRKMTTNELRFIVAANAYNPIIQEELEKYRIKQISNALLYDKPKGLLLNYQEEDLSYVIRLAFKYNSRNCLDKFLLKISPDKASLLIILFDIVDNTPEFHCRDDIGEKLILYIFSKGTSIEDLTLQVIKLQNKE